MNNNQEIEKWEKINLAIDSYLKLGFWHIPNNSDTESLCVEILDKVKEVYNYATSFTVDWHIDTMQTVLIRLEYSLQENYKNLNKKSVETLKRCFSYNWK